MLLYRRLVFVLLAIKLGRHVCVDEAEHGSQHLSVHVCVDEAEHGSQHLSVHVLDLDTLTALLCHGTKELGHEHRGPRGKYVLVRRDVLAGFEFECIWIIINIVRMIVYR